MAPPSFSPNGSITSHTLSAGSFQLPQAMQNGTMQPALRSSLTKTLSDSPHSFLQSPLPLYTDALLFAKSCLDSLAADVSEAQIQRQRANRKKRKRSGREHDDRVEQPLQLRKVHVDGFGIGQVWEQAKRVLDASRAEAEAGVRLVEEELGGATVRHVDQQKGQSATNGKAVHFDRDQDGFSDDSVLEDDFHGIEDELEDIEDVGNLDGEEGELELDGEDLDEKEEDFEDGEDIEDDLSEEEEPEDELPTQEFVADPNGLNDGFFSINDFNKQSEFLEQ
ncbi:hypothetical protein LTS18_007486, partial [Coniosporium uncinatum]